MRLKCPRCEFTGESGDAACRQCGLSFQATSLVVFYFRTLGYWWNKTAVIQSPSCPHLVPVNAHRCPKCGKTITVKAAIHSTLAPPRRRWRRFLAKAKPETKRNIQIWWLLLNIIALIILLNVTAYNLSELLTRSIALSSLYLSFFMLFARWFVPRRLFRLIRERASLAVKVSILFTYLNLFLLMQCVVNVFWSQAVYLAVLFVMTWASAWLFVRWLVPVDDQVRSVFADYGHESNFDPGDYQGRRAKYD